jgi:hypothetical protein
VYYLWEMAVNVSHDLSFASMTLEEMWVKAEKVSCTKFM